MSSRGQPREPCLVVTDNNLKMRNSLLFSALLHIYWHKSTSLHFHSGVCQKIPAGSRYHKPFCTLAPCLTPLQMHLKGELLAYGSSEPHGKGACGSQTWPASSEHQPWESVHSSSCSSSRSHRAGRDISLSLIVESCRGLQLW